MLDEYYILKVIELALPNFSQSLAKKEALSFLKSEEVSDSSKTNESEKNGPSINQGQYEEYKEKLCSTEPCDLSIIFEECPVIGAKVLGKPSLSYFKKIEIGDEVVAFVPFSRKDQVKVLPGNKIAVAEKYLLPLQKATPLKEATIAASSALFIVNSLFEKGKLRDNESVLILNGGSHNQAYILWEIVAKVMKGRAFIVCRDSEEFSFLRKVSEAFEGNIILQTEEIISQIREETGGRGVDLIIDLELKHDVEEKRTAISCLAPGGRWFVSDCNFQLDPPEIRQLFCKNSSLVFGFEEILTLFSTDLGKALNMIEFMLKLLANNQIQIFIENKFQSIEEYKEKKENNFKFLGSGIISLGK